MFSGKRDRFVFSGLMRAGSSFLLVACMSLGVASCGSQSSSERLSQLRFDSVEDRYPIHLVDGMESVELRVVSGASGLDEAQGRLLSRFLSYYRQDQDQDQMDLTVWVPSGVDDRLALQRVVDDLRHRFESAGISREHVVYKHYEPQGPYRVAPLVFVTYEAVRAVADERCGGWFGRYPVSDREFRDQYSAVSADYGCSSRRAMASMMAYPEDLEGPHAIESTASSRWYGVYKKYIKGEKVYLKDANISDVGK